MADPLSRLLCAYGLDQIAAVMAKEEMDVHLFSELITDADFQEVRLVPT